MTNVEMQTPAGDWISLAGVVSVTVESALRARIAELEVELADADALRKAAQATNAELLQGLLDLRKTIREIRTMIRA